jgi:hypothetical protein
VWTSLVVFVGAAFAFWRFGVRARDEPPTSETDGSLAGGDESDDRGAGETELDQPQSSQHSD